MISALGAGRSINQGTLTSGRLDKTSLSTERSLQEKKKKGTLAKKPQAENSYQPEER